MAVEKPARRGRVGEIVATAEYAPDEEAMARAIRLLITGKARAPNGTTAPGTSALESIVGRIADRE